MISTSHTTVTLPDEKVAKEYTSEQYTIKTTQ